MIRGKLLPAIVFVFASCFSFAAGNSTTTEQKDFKSATCRTDFGSYTISDGSDVEAVRDFTQKQIPNLQNKQAALKLTFSNNSPGGYHYTFCQLYSGIPVFSSEIRVNVSRKNQVYSIFDDSYDMSQWKVDMTDFDYQELPFYKDYVNQYFSIGNTANAKKVVAYDEHHSSPELCYLVTLKDRSGHQRSVLLSQEHIIYEHDNCIYHAASSPPDSLVTGLIFNPDPLTTAHKLYYGSYQGHDSLYQNFFNLDTPALNLQRMQKSFYANFNGSVFSLQNSYVRLQNLGFNTINPVTSNTPSFNYTRHQVGFLDVMVYYHLNIMREYVHSLGFNLADTLLIADSHASAVDNDFFVEPNSIQYGTGGVPDCQDADVIVHEYTHFLSWSANQSNGNGASYERNGIDEGSGDYIAASYSASIDTCKWNWVFNWDGHNEFWAGRFVDDRTVYPAIPTTPGVTGYYRYGQIWSSALMQIWWDIGRRTADSLLLQTLYGLGSNITVADAAQQYIKADSLLFNGKYHCEIVRDLHAHGLAVDRSCGAYPAGVSDIDDAIQSCKFTAYPDGFRVETLQPNTAVDITVYDITGQKLETFHNITTGIKPSLPAGIYIIDVSVDGSHKGYKWVPLR